MKAFRIIAVSLFCALVFCSCSDNSKKLESGTWELDAKASYEVRNNKRHYFDEQITDSTKLEDHKYIMDFDDGEAFIYTKDSKGEEHKKYKYHTDKEHFYIDGTECTIIKLSDKKLIFECSDDDELIHYEFDNMYYSPFLHDWLFWFGIIWMIVIFVAVAVGSFRGILGWNSTPFDINEPEDEESLSDETIQLMGNCKDYVDHYIETDKGMNEICEINDGLWHTMRTGRVFWRKVSEGELYLMSNNESGEKKVIAQLPDGKIPFEGGLTRLNRIRKFVIGKGNPRNVRRWLQTKEGLDWQNTADGIIWTREQVFIDNQNSFARKCRLKSKEEWKEGLKMSLIWSAIWSVIWFIIACIVEGKVFKRIADGTLSEFIKGISLVDALIAFSKLYIAFFILYALWFITMMACNLISEALAGKWYHKPLVHFKDFSRRVHVVNKANKIYD